MDPYHGVCLSIIGKYDLSCINEKKNQEFFFSAGSGSHIARRIRKCSGLIRGLSPHAKRKSASPGHGSGRSGWDHEYGICTS